MDVDEVEKMAGRLDTQSSALTKVVGVTDSVVGQAAGAWRGDGGGAFQAEWTHQHRATVLRAARALSELASSARRNAAAQRQTSNSYVPSGSGSSGAGGSSGGSEGPDDISWWLKKLGIMPEGADAVHVGLWMLAAGSFLTAGALDALVRHNSVFQPRGEDGRWRSSKGMTARERLNAQGRGTLNAKGEDHSWRAKAGKGVEVGKWETAGRWANRAGAVVAGGIAGFDEWEQDKSMPTGDRVDRAVTKGAATGLGAWGGAAAGAWAGAAVGTFLIPIPGVGTVVGGAVGGLLGGFAGSEAGGFIGDEINKTAGGIGHAVSGAAEGVSHAVSGAAEGVSHAASGLWHSVWG